MLESTGALAEGNPSHRLLVYVDDMHNALINLEVELRDLFEDGDAWDGRMTAGFTAGSGTVSAGHTISNWHLYEVCNEHEKKGGAGFLSGFFT